MKAHIEFLSGIVRVGEVTDRFGADYEYAAAWSSSDGKTAKIKALVSPDKMLTSRHAAAAIMALEERTGLSVIWERATAQGDFRMAHIKAHHTEKLPVANAALAKGADGSYDLMHMAVQSMNSHSNMVNGHTEILDFHQEPIAGKPKATRYVLEVEDK